MTKQTLKKENNRLNESKPFYDVLKLGKLSNKQSYANWLVF